MKQNETLLNTAEPNIIIDEFGEEHIGTSWDTPLRDDAFDIEDEEKIALIAYHFKEIMQIMRLDLNDDSLKGTPLRVGKMYIKEIFSGLDPRNKPEWHCLKINMATSKCWLKKISCFIPIVNTILCPSLVRHMWLT